MTYSSGNGDRTLHHQTVEILPVRDGKITIRRSFANDTQAVIRFFS